jgi:Protein of unknown function (DUF2510)
MAGEVYRPDWYPDPLGRFEFRFHNGAEWTSDVATGGVRYVDALGIAAPLHQQTSPARRNKMALAAMILGIVSVTIAWMPFVVVVGAVCALLAIVFGVIAVRHVDGRGFAIAGLVTGVVGAGLCVVGVLLSVAVFHEFDAYAFPAESRAGITSCEFDGARATATGEILNLDDEPADFTVTVVFLRPGTDNAHRSAEAVVDDVAPGEVATFEVSREVRLEDVTCEIDGVAGPLPFGISDEP